MALHHQFMAIAAGAVVVAAFVPSLFADKVAKFEPTSSNITHSEPASPSLLGNGTGRSAPVERRRRGCDTNGDLKGIPSCGKNAAPVLARGEVRREAGGKTVTVAQDASGAFSLSMRMNGRRVPSVIDTGASAVAINMSTARLLGLNIPLEEFKHEAQTANGLALYARTTIREMRIGDIIVDNVEAIVLADRALGTTLLGMTFLNRLSKYSVENGELSLTQ